jgi:hypothetical protein
MAPWFTSKFGGEGLLMAAVIVVPETDGFRLDVSHADTV